MPSSENGNCDSRVDSVKSDGQIDHITSFCNLSKGGVDVVDALKGTYSVARVSCTWPMPAQMIQ